MQSTVTHPQVNFYLQEIKFHIKQHHKLLWERYVQLGSKTVKLLCYSKDFIPLIEKQLSYALKKEAANFDATIVLWNEKEIESFLEKFIDEKTKSRLKAEQISAKVDEVSLLNTDKTNPQFKLLTRINTGKEGIVLFEAIDEKYSTYNPIIRISLEGGVIEAYDPENNVYYYGVKDLRPEEFIKKGHIFVHIFNKIIKTPTANLIHGAVVGIDNKGILLCGRGQRGKSTLAVLAMMDGFDYVSDDYLVLEKEGDALYSYPIYSIITLSPKMYNELYDDLKGKFVSNNARRDKYVIDIKAYHETFRDKYPIKVCVFPQIVADEKPSIVPCKKGQAITQLVHSTINQMEDKYDTKTIQKLMSFIQNFEFYQINLCPDIKANVECLRNFANQIK